jgi:hypothetical protein
MSHCFGSISCPPIHRLPRNISNISEYALCIRQTLYIAALSLKGLHLLCCFDVCVCLKTYLLLKPPLTSNLHYKICMRNLLKRIINHFPLLAYKFVYENYN